MIPVRDTRIAIAADPDDSPDTRSAFLAKHSLQSGCLVVELRPGNATLDWLTRAVMRSLGKTLEGRSGPRNAIHGWWEAECWCRGEQVHTIVVLRAEQLSRRLVANLIDLAMSCGLQLLLVVQGHQSAPAMWKVRLRWPLRELDVDDALLLVPDASPAKDADDTHATALLPDLPASDFFLFRATCYRELAEEQFRVVDELYTSASETLNQLGDELEAATLARHVRAVSRSSVTSRHFTIQLRAIQAAAFTRGWFVKAEEGYREAADLEEEQLEDIEHAARSLRTLRSPSQAALGVVRIVTRLDPDRIAQLQVADIKSDGSSIRLPDGTEVSVPDCAQGILRAHQCYRRAGIFDAHAPLFLKSTETETHAAVSATIRLGLQRITRDTGLKLLTTYRDTKVSDQRWLDRKGISIHSLMSATRSPVG